MRVWRLDSGQDTPAHDRHDHHHLDGTGEPGAATAVVVVGTAPTTGSLRGQPQLPAIAQAVSELPRDPRSGQGWYPVPVAGTYNECAQLSAVIIKANTNSTNPNTRAVMFHLGKYIPTGVPDTYGFNGIDASQSTGDTVALAYVNGLGMQSVVKFRWNGNGVELIGNTG